MPILWSSKQPDKTFRNSYSTSEVFGFHENFLPYARKYDALRSEELISLIRAAKKNHWEALDLSNCGLTELPDELWELSELRFLFLGNFPLINGESRLNTISIIPRKIESLKNLTALSLQNLHCLKIEGDTPLDLPILKYLDIFGCGFRQIPNALLVPSLRGLGFNCPEDQLSSEILSLKNLRELYLGGSKIKSLPNDIDCLKKLEKLALWGSKIEKLPPSISRLPRLTQLSIDDTPIAKDIPPEIQEQSAQQIINYYFNFQSAKKEYFNESKLIIVGQGHVGKTCLLNRLVNETFVEEPSTEGINISIWPYRYYNESIRLNVWDFGGQEIYHSTHQFFLTKRSLYLLVWDALAEKEYGRIDYWLRTIQSLADDSPIIIVVNKCDKGIGRIERLTDDEYKTNYPQIKDILYVSCKDDVNIDKLRKLIKRTAKGLPLMKTKWIKTWMDVRKEIEQAASEKDYFLYSDYLTICFKNGIKDDEEALSLIKYLHDLGIVLYYYDDPLLRNLVILSSEWGTDAVYKVLDEQERILKDRNGVLNFNDLPSIWTDRKKYPTAYYPHLLNLMEKFQLAFKIDQNNYLVAELLNNQQINLGWTLDKSNTLSFRYEYDFLPAGIMTRLIVSANQYLLTIDGVKQCWKKGAYLFHNTAKARVRLFDGISERYVQIDVVGDVARDKKDLLAIIRVKLDEINSRFKKIKITKKIPCCCPEDCSYLFDYDSLLKAEKKGVKQAQCQSSWENVDISKLLDGIDDMQQDTINNVYNIFVNTFTGNSCKYDDANIIDGKAPAVLLSNDDINQQILSWAQKSNLFKTVTGLDKNADLLNTLETALCGEESERVSESYNYMKAIWEIHPEWGLMPNYKLLSELEHSGKYYKKYRDHLAHMFKVFVLGLYLYQNSKLITDAFTQKGFDESEFAAIWSIASLYHDIGYIFDTQDKAIDGENADLVCSDLMRILKNPLDQLKIINARRENDLQNNYRCYVRHGCVWTDIKTCLAEFKGFGDSVGLRKKDAVERNPIKVYYDMVAGPNSTRSYYDHGINSAIILLFMQQSVKDYLEDIYSKIANKGILSEEEETMLNNEFSSLDSMASRIKQAAYALALHNISKEHSESFIDNLMVAGVDMDTFRIPINKEPFAYLLRLCDELQCWDRPYLSGSITAGPYLKGEKVHIEIIEDMPKFYIDDSDEKGKIIHALKEIIDPSVDIWIGD